jgi:7-carboxy-7-deazaguanine synthase
MRVSEVFYSLQGEGMLAGTPSVFVRLAGCGLRCRWCDTKYAWDFGAGQEYEPSRIVEEIGRWPCSFVVLTGGEPMTGPDFSARPDLADLTHRLKESGKHITIETAGVLFVPDLACDLMSISPKLTNSLPRTDDQGEGHDPVRFDVETIRRLIRAYPYQLKFVVDSPQDIVEIRKVLADLGPVSPERVMLMPQATTAELLASRSGMVADLCREAGLRFGPRLHIALWNGQRGV